jgi:hypothetical protein
MEGQYPARMGPTATVSHHDGMDAPMGLDMRVKPPTRCSTGRIVCHHDGASTAAARVAQLEMDRCTSLAPAMPSCRQSR